MEWWVFYENINAQRIEQYNIFKHGGFRKDVEEHLKKHEDREVFAEALKRSVRYYFWAKAEWEVLVSPLVGGRDDRSKKIDVSDLVMLNWDVFVDYVWGNKS